jgi:4-hydroxysphinganine ceramide fatty acyl 2-hydroxylase
MEFNKIQNKGQGRLFKSELMEQMTKTHPLVIYTIYLPLISSMLYCGATYKGLTIAAEAIYFLAGIFLWSFFEYLMHRYLFHMIADSPRAKRILYTVHGVHHKYPRDRERLFMPPVPSIIVGLVVFSIIYSLLKWNAFAFFPGFVLGYLLYGSMHFAIHTFAPPRFLKALWRNHHLHHYKTPNKGFGVSSVLWDVIFHTVPSKEM